MIPVLGTIICSLLDDNAELVAELPVQGWFPGPDSEWFPMVPLVDRLVVLRPGINAYELECHAYE